MANKTEHQKRHEKLVVFLSQFSQYSTEDGKPSLKIVPQSITFNKVHKISGSDINKGVVVFTDALNIYSGSAGNIDMYRLMNAYLTVPEYRDKINTVVEEAMSYAHNKSKKNK